MPTLPAPQYPVAAQVYLPPLHDLLRTITPTPPEPGSRWETGFVFEPEGWNEVAAIPGAWCGADWEDTFGGAKPADSPPDVVYYQPFGVVSSYSCKFGRSWDERVDKVKRFLDAGKSKAIEHELWTGALSDVADTGNMRLAVAGSGGGGSLTADDLAVVVNPGFNPAAGVATAAPVSVGAAFDLLSQALGDTPTAAKGCIHVTPLVGQVAVADGALVEDRNVLRTRSRGDLVIVGNGYPGTGPGGVVPGPGLVWMHATSMIQLRLGDVVVLPATINEALNRRTNSLVTRAEQTVAAYWDGQFQASVLVNLNLSADDDLGYAT